MVTKAVMAGGMCLVLGLGGIAGRAIRSGAAPIAQINVPNVDPKVQKRFEQLQQKEELERLQKENKEDAEKIVLLAAQLEQYADSAGKGPFPPDAVRKAKEVETLAKRVRGRLRESALRIRVH
jgi:hypothetical protein